MNPTCSQGFFHGRTDLSWEGVPRPLAKLDELFMFYFSI